MEITPRRGPMPLDQTEATRELARQLLRLLHHAGLIPAQLAGLERIPYDVLTLNRFLSGETLPPPELIDVIVDLCGGDRQTLRYTYERALRATPPAPGYYPAPPYLGGMQAVRYQQPPPPATTTKAINSPGTTTGVQRAVSENSRSRRALRSRLVTAAVGFSAVSAIAVTTTMVALGTAGNAGDPAAAASRERTDEGPGPEANPAAPGAPAASTPTTKSAPAPAPAAGQPSTTGGPTELISNGGFTNDSADDWWPSENVSLEVDDGRLQVDVAKGSGRGHWDAMVMQTLPRVEVGKDYALKFQGSGKSSTSITVSIQREMKSDAPTLVSERIKLTTKMKTFTYRFTAEEALNPPLICFQVGGHPKGHTMWLDGISLVEVDPAVEAKAAE